MKVSSIKCPYCGNGIIIEKHEPDGYYMGYSVACAGYSMRSRKKHDKKMAFFGFDSPLQAERYIRSYIEDVSK